MQKFLFVRHNKGVAKATGKPYDIAEVSDGLSSFPLTPGNEDISTKLDSLKKGDQFEAEVHVEANFNGLSGTLVAIKLPQK